MKDHDMEIIASEKTRVGQAAERHSRGYNCAQSVACTYADLAGLDEELVFKAAEGFGLGMGCMEGTCGAITGACLLAGLINSTGNLEKPNSKASTSRLSAQIINGFLEMNGAERCRDLKGVDTGKPLRSCPDCIRDAAMLAEKILFKDKLN